MKRWKVYCNLDLSLKHDALRYLEDIADVVHFPPTQESLIDNINDFDAYLAAGSVKMNSEIIDKSSKLKVIATPSTGTDHIDTVYAKQKNIDVLHIAKELQLLEGFTATAEQAWALLLACIRNLPAAIDCAKNGNWARERFTGTQLYNKTLGIIGLGRLGKMMVSFGNGFNMKVIGYDIEKKNIDGVKQVTLDELLESSDAISVHIHLNEKNKNFISKDIIKKMKKGVVLINTSRGAIIDENALLDNLKSGHVGSAGLDVIHGEWDKDIYDHPLIKYARQNDNLIISPHIGGSTVESIIGARVFIGKRLAEYITKMEGR